MPATDSKSVARFKRNQNRARQPPPPRGCEKKSVASQTEQIYQEINCAVCLDTIYEVCLFMHDVSFLIFYFIQQQSR